MHTSPALHLSYRPDIDGLRAFAVLAVICEHFGVAPFSGGYVGVDIFFVISGYLITSIILPQMQQGTFRFARFYERRCRRLLPALYAMLLCLALVPAVMPSFPYPEEMYQSLGATLLFAANMFFATRQGYFDAASGEKPLLHMWSLSVEEQFYCIIPLLLLLLIKYGRHRRALIPQAMSLVLLTSFLFAVVSVHAAQSMAFYWLPGRAWELCVGCLLAYALNHTDTLNHTSTLPQPTPWPLSQPLSQPTSQHDANRAAPQHLLSLCALALLALPVFFYDRTTLFPAHMALSPCLGTALFIYLGAQYPKSWLIRAFSLRGLVFVGLLSYGLYLWHWPLWVLLQHVFIQPSSSQSGPTLLFLEAGKGIPYLLVRFPLLKICAQYPVLVTSLLTVCCALLSYLVIERPLRSRRVLGSSKAFFTVLLLCTLLLGALSCWACWASWGQGAELSLARQWLTTQTESEAGQDITVQSKAQSYLAARKDRGDTNARSIEPEDFATMGMPSVESSNAALPQRQGGQSELGRMGGQDGQGGQGKMSEQAIFAALGDSHYAMLAPLFEEFFTANNLHGQHSALIRYPLLGLPDYTSWGREETPLAYAHLQDLPVKHVLLSTRWVWRLTGDAPWAVARDYPALDFATFKAGVEATIHNLTAQNKEVWLVMPIPEMPFDVPTSLEVTAQSGGHVREVGISYEEYLARAGHVRQLFTALQSDKVHVLDPAQILCAGGFCRAEKDGKSLYADDNHLTSYGLQMVREAFAPLFSKLLNTKKHTERAPSP